VLGLAMTKGARLARFDRKDVGVGGDKPHPYIRECGGLAMTGRGGGRYAYEQIVRQYSPPIDFSTAM